MSTQYLDRVTHRNMSPSFGFGDIGDNHHSEVVIEAVALESVGTRRSTLLHESFSKPLVLVPGIWVACGYDAPLARFDTVHSDIADAKCDRFTVVCLETVFLGVPRGVARRCGSHRIDLSEKKSLDRG
jgi:hypothetical protein